LLPTTAHFEPVYLNHYRLLDPHGQKSKWAPISVLTDQTLKELEDCLPCAKLEFDSSSPEVFFVSLDNAKISWKIIPRFAWGVIPCETKVQLFFDNHAIKELVVPPTHSMAENIPALTFEINCQEDSFFKHLSEDQTPDSITSKLSKFKFR
jgi:hypothetical protein